MTLNREYIGRNWTSSEIYEVSREKLRDYAIASGELHPVYLDPVAARKLGHLTVIAPPTFVAVLWRRMNTWPLREPDIGRSKEPNMLLTNQRITHHRPIRLGDRLVFSTTVKDIRDMGEHEYMRMEHRITAEDGEQICTIVESGVSRGTGAGRET
jgi:acyl dehydratase